MCWGEPVWDFIFGPSVKIRQRQMRPGINVNRYKYVATCIGSVIAGLGGLYYVMDYANGVWSNDGFGDRGGWPLPWLFSLSGDQI